MSERELLWTCIAFLERTSHEEAGDRLRLADKLRTALADRPEQPVEIRRTEYTPAGHPVSVVDVPQLGFEQWAIENGFNPAGPKAWRKWVELHSATVARPEQPVAWRIRWSAESTTDWVDFKKIPPTDVDRRECESLGTFEYAYAAPVARPEPAQPMKHDEIYERNVASQEPAQPVAPLWHRTVENDLEQEKLHRERISAARYVDIVFDGPPSHESGHFVEVEDASGKSIKFGEWVHRPDGYWVLRIAAPPSHPAPSEAGAERQVPRGYCGRLYCQVNTAGYCHACDGPAKGDAA